MYLVTFYLQRPLHTHLCQPKKVTMKKLFVFAVVIIIACAAKAQAPYNQALGVKLPGGFSATYKKFINAYNNVEAQAVFWNKGFRLVGLYEFNFDIPDVNGLRWYVGPGAHIGFWKSRYKDDYGSKPDFGVDGVIGLDYKLKDIPIDVSVDWQPSVTLVGSAGFSPVFGGVGIRYTF